MYYSDRMPTPLEYFESLVQSDGEFPLLEAALSIAQDEYPDLDLQAALTMVDGMQARLQKRCPARATALERIHLLNRFLYEELGFGVNANDYYDPDNSFLHQVLHTRRGIPISIGILWLELARSIGLDAHGISFPGHFMLKVLLQQGQVVLDPLTGKSFTSEELAERIRQFMPGMHFFNDEIVPLALFLQSAKPRQIIARMLRNLKEIYRSQQDLPRQLAVQDRLVVLLPRDWTERRDRGLVHADLNHIEEAIGDLQLYLQQVRNAVDVESIAQRMQALKGNDISDALD